MKVFQKYIDFKLITLLAITYAVISSINFLKNAYLKISGYRFQDMNWDTLIVGAHLSDFIIVMIFITIIAALTKYMIERKVKQSFIIGIHVFFSFFIGIFIFFFAEFFSLIFGDIPFSDYDFKFNFTRYMSVIDLNFLVYVSLVTVIYVYYYFNRMQRAELKKVELQNQLSRAQLGLLQSQLHPHFLFNTLNSIFSLMDIDIKKSKNMVIDLSYILRDVLDNKDRNLIELQDELLTFEKYINIKKIRFSDDLEVNMNLQNGIENVLIPNMILQPLVENAIKHGYGEKNQKLKVAIAIYRKKERLHIYIANDGRPIEDKLKVLLQKGVGIKNVIGRLETLYRADFKFTICNNENLVVVEVDIPFQLAESELII